MHTPARRGPIRPRLSIVVGLVVALAALPVAAQTFSDETAAAGITYLQRQGHPPFDDVHMQPDLTGGAAAGDVDGDGWPDLFVTRADAPPILFLNDRDGTFTDVTAAAGLDQAQPTGSNGAAFGDIDNDGDLDLYVTAQGDTRFYLYVNDGTGSFTEEAVARGAACNDANPNHGQGVAFGDYDLDGWLDIYVTEWRWDDGTDNPNALPSHNRLFRNLGATSPGHFVDVTDSVGANMDGVIGDREPGTHGFSPRFADIDRDGRPELLVAADYRCSRIYWNQGGTFVDGTVAAGVGIDENGMGSTIADFDGDGWLDWFVTSIARSNGVEIYIGNVLYRYVGARQFVDATVQSGVRDGFWGWGTSSFDYDNDGDMDLVMTNGVYFAPPWNSDPSRLWRNDGSGAFTEVSGSSGLVDFRDGKGLLTFDYDRDGDLDVFIANHAQQPRLYRNDGGNANQWLQLRPLGAGPSNAQGVGARISVVPDPGDPPLVRETSAGSNFLASDEPIVHVGLGADTTAALVTIEWPGGTVQGLVDVPAGQRLDVTEPASDPIALEMRLDGADVVAEWTTSGAPAAHLVFRSDGPRFDAGNLLATVGGAQQSHVDAGAAAAGTSFYVVVAAD